MQHIRHEGAKIAFQGAKGAYSDLAARHALPGIETIPTASFEGVFALLEQKKVEYAFIPIENSIAGRVADIHHLLPKSEVCIVGEHYEPIHHMLLGIPGSSLESIQEVHSHVHALGQCRAFTKSRGYMPVVHSDTAQAAHDVSMWNDPSKAAIGSRLAGELYELEVLSEEIEDAAHNTTRFLLLAREPVAVEKDGPVITTLFVTLRSVPAALYKAIGGFATNGINLSKIESYVSGEHFSIAQFHIDAEGHPDEVGMQHALDELRFYSDEVRTMGVYPASRSRGAH